MYRFTLTHSILGSIVTEPPIGWESLEYTIARSEKYHGCTISFTAQLQFTGLGRDFIDNVKETYGYASEISVLVEIYYAPLRKYITFVEGTLNFANYASKDIGENGNSVFVTEIDIVSSKFDLNLANRDGVKINYKYLFDCDGNAIIPNITELETTDILLRLAELEQSVEAVYPHELFERIINSITGDFKRLYAPCFGKTVNGYSSDGRHAYKMISPALWLRGYSNTEASVNQSLYGLFESMSNILCLGLAIETIDGKRKVWMDDRENFYQPEVVLTIGGADDANNLKISGLEFKYDSSLLCNAVSVGYNVKNTEKNDIGNAEYNKKSDYTLPDVPISNTLNLVSNLRADGTGAYLLLNNQKVEVEDKAQNNQDDETYIFCCKDIDGVLTSIELEDFTTYPTIYGGGTPIYCNLDITPARNLYRHEKIVSIGLQNSRAKKVLFQNNNQPCKPSTRKTGETFDTADCADIPVIQLKEPYLSGIVASFSAPFGIDELLALSANRHAKIKFWDYKVNQYRTGWIKNVSTKVETGETNYEILLSYYIGIEEEFYYLLAEDGMPLLSEDGELMLTEHAW